MLSKNIIKFTTSGKIRDFVAEISQSADLTKAQAGSLRFEADIIAGELELLAKTIHDDESEPDLYRGLAMSWLELKFRWTRFNDIAQYQAVFGGGVDPEVMARGSMISSFIGEIEKHLNGADLQRLSDFSSQPLEALRPDVAGAERTVEGHREIAQYLEDFLDETSKTYSELSSVRGRIQSSEMAQFEAFSDIVTRYEDRLHRLQSRMDPTFRVNFDTICLRAHAELEAYAEESERLLIFQPGRTSGVEIESRIVPEVMRTMDAIGRALIDRLATEVPLATSVCISIEAELQGTTLVLRISLLNAGDEQGYDAWASNQIDELACREVFAQASRPSECTIMIVAEVDRPDSGLERRCYLIGVGSEKLAIPARSVGDPSTKDTYETIDLRRDPGSQGHKFLYCPQGQEAHLVFADESLGVIEGLPLRAGDSEGMRFWFLQSGDEKIPVLTADVWRRLQFGQDIPQATSWEKSSTL